MLICDSSSKHISPHLEASETKWSVANTVYSTKEALRSIDD